ncbi:MAG TPA: hypothetical protein VGH94_00725 [Acidimicrobiales bacterium]|jgi:hypothetical protein
MADTIPTPGKTSPTDRAGWPAQPELGPADDEWHDHSPHWWETETAWFTFNVPERKVCGSLYVKARAMQENCDGGAWVWDDSEADALYDVQPAGLPFPNRGGSLLDLTAPNGVTIKVLEPLMRYHTTYRDPGKFEADLVHEGIIRPHSHPIGAWPYWNSRHFDQPMHTTGTIVVAGEEIAVDSYTIRDRSWGPRPEGPTPPDKKLERGAWTFNERPARAALPYSVGYMYGAQDARHAFLAGTSPLMTPEGELSDDLDPGAGYLVRDGIYAPLVRGYRETELDPVGTWVRRVHIEGIDALGRKLDAVGEVVSRWGHHQGGCAFVHWTWDDGCDGWGEDESGAPADWMAALDGKTFPDLT